MNSTLQRARASIREMPDAMKCRLVDELLNELDQPDPAVDALWLEEVRERRASYLQGKTSARDYAKVMVRYARP